MGFLSDVFGGGEARAAEEAARIQAEATERGIEEVGGARERGLGFLQPFQQVGELGIGAAPFLTDPQAQFEFLQQNPLFRAALEQAGTETKGIAAARGRLSAGDTLQQLSQNVLLAAQPLIGGQKQSIMDLLGIGRGVAGQQAGIETGAGRDIVELITGGGAAAAAGEVGAARARGQESRNILETGLSLLAGGIFSDERLKSDIKLIDIVNGYRIYSWTWNRLAETLFRLVGDSSGVLAQEVQNIRPEAVVENSGYLMVNYPMIGITNGH